MGRPGLWFTDRYSAVNPRSPPPAPRAYAARRRRPMAAPLATLHPAPLGGPSTGLRLPVSTDYRRHSVIGPCDAPVVVHGGTDGGPRIQCRDRRIGAYGQARAANGFSAAARVTPGVRRTYPRSPGCPLGRRAALVEQSVPGAHRTADEMRGSATGVYNRRQLVGPPRRAGSVRPLPLATGCRIMRPRWAPRKRMCWQSSPNAPTGPQPCCSERRARHSGGTRPCVSVNRCRSSCPRARSASNGAGRRQG